MVRVSRRRWRRLRVAALLAVGALIVIGCRLEILDDPFLDAEGQIRTRPFVGTSIKMSDGEGLAYVPNDNALWLADDNADRIHEVDVDTGALGATIDRADLAAAPRYGGGPAAGLDRAGDLEALVYDQTHDHLYAVSASCCGPNAEPAIFRLVRTGSSGDFAPDSWQPLNDDYTAASATPSGQLYLSEQNDIHSYDFTTNAIGPAFSIPGISAAIFGLGFSVDGQDLFVADNSNTVSRVDWATRTIVPGYEFTMSSKGVGQARAVELVGGRLYVQDGDDTLSTTDPLKYAVHIFDIDGTERSPADPISSFTATPSGGAPSLSITFDAGASFDPDGAITVWGWFFGDGSPFRNGETVSHEYASPGVYEVLLFVIDDAQHWSLVSSFVTVQL